MTVTNELMYELLKQIRSEQKKHSEEFKKVTKQLESIDHHMAGFHVTVAYQQEEISELRDRVEQIEKRLELRD